MVLYTCDKCNKMFTKKYNYEIHINRKNSCINSICQLCGKNFQTAARLQRHLNGKTLCV